LKNGSPTPQSNNWWYLLIAAVIVLLAFGFVWRRTHSNLHKGLIALRAAYEKQRPAEARLTDFAYAPQQRGEAENVDYVQRDLASRLLLDEIGTKKTADNYHALGQYYFATHEFEKARDQFNSALQLDPNHAKAHADLGALLLESGRRDWETGRAGATQTFADSMQHLNRALELNSSLNEGLFNRALLSQYIKLPSQAEHDWRSYLAKEPNSQWATEARQHLNVLAEQQRNTSLSDADVWENFRNASASGDEATAAKLISAYHNRTGNVVFEQALNSYLDSVTAKQTENEKSALRLLTYAGDLERRHANDTFFAGLANFYENASADRLASLSQARAMMKAAHDGYGRSAIGDSLKQFSEARKLFEAAGDVWEGIFAGYWISFCLYQQHKTDEGLTNLQPLIHTSDARGYRWLSVRMLYLSSVLEYDLTNYSRAVELAERSLALAEETNDVVGQLNGLGSLIEYYRVLSYFDKSLDYVQRSLKLLGETTLDPIQGCRVYGFVASSFADAGWYEAAVAYQQEALQYAFNTTRPATISTNLAFLSRIKTKLKRFDEALAAAERAFEIAEGGAADPARKDRMAYASLQLGHVYRQTENCDKAIASYDRAIELYRQLNYYTQIYQGHKGRLLCYLAQGDDGRAEQEITTALDLVESYREKIFEDTNRETFFDAEQGVYDIAIGFQYAKKQSPAKAFEYSEFSRARSLLDLVNSDARVKNPDNDLLFDGATHPLNLEQIKQRLPNEMQLVQFASLDDRLIVWVISGNQISDTAVPISRERLNDKVMSYLRSISSVSASQTDEPTRQARELYDLLIKPVASLLDTNKQLCIVPDKVLNLLPFSTLISTTSGNYLLADFVLTASPSATMAVLLSESAKAKPAIGGEKVFSVGNPRFDRRAYPELADLTSAEWEATIVGGIYPAHSSLLTDDATTTAVVNEMQKADIIHFALHSVLDQRFPTRSKFLMAKASSTRGDAQTAESALFAYDIYGLNLTRARLAVLSACETGSGRYFGGEGVINMARPFLAAGVPLVVASLWPVESNSTARLIVDFHKLRAKEGLPTARALQQAQLNMLHDPDDRLHQPYYWAPFVLIGGYASF